MYICMCIYIYIYIYVWRGSRRGPGEDRERSEVEVQGQGTRGREGTPPLPEITIVTDCRTMMITLARSLEVEVRSDPEIRGPH